MKKKKNVLNLECDYCENSFTLSFKSSNRPEVCPFCGENLRYFDSVEDLEDSPLEDMLDDLTSEEDEDY